jgi:hypothetical protein
MIEIMLLNQKLLAMTAALLMLGVVAGCSGVKKDEVEVTGNVTIDGQPIPQGVVQFIATDGQTPTGGGVIKDGKYVAKVPPGEKTVLILGTKVVGQVPESKDMPGSRMVDKVETVTPPQYNAEHLTPLKATITDSQAGVDFALTKNGKGA